MDTKRHVHTPGSIEEHQRELGGPRRAAQPMEDLGAMYPELGKKPSRRKRQEKSKPKPKPKPKKSK